jgi:hypothetical protein
VSRIIQGMSGAAPASPAVATLLLAPVLQGIEGHGAGSVK